MLRHGFIRFNFILSFVKFEKIFPCFKKKIINFQKVSINFEKCEHGACPHSHRLFHIMRNTSGHANPTSQPICVSSAILHAPYNQGRIRFGNASQYYISTLKSYIFLLDFSLVFFVIFYILSFTPFGNSFYSYIT